ncbi:MAG: hypothetical protein GY711_05960, partial [bacterium]|nr:hypothetical protein [bacterium]
MKKQLFTLAAAGLCASVASAQTGLWSQSTDNNTIVQGSASCLNNPAGITDNSYWRLYDPAQFGHAAAFNIDSIRFG